MGRLEVKSMKRKFVSCNYGFPNAKWGINILQASHIYSVYFTDTLIEDYTGHLFYFSFTALEFISFEALYNVNTHSLYNPNDVSW